MKGQEWLQAQAQACASQSAWELLDAARTAQGLPGASQMVQEWLPVQVQACASQSAQGLPDAMQTTQESQRA